MKLLLAADIFPPESGGPATYVVTLANELTKQGVDVRIVSLNPESDISKVNCPVFVVKSSFKPLRYWQYYKLLLKQGRDVDVIYAMGPVNAGWPALRAAKKLGKKFVVKVVGDYAWEQLQNHKSKIINHKSSWCSIEEFQKIKSGGKIGLLKKIESLVVRKADAVITPCVYLKRLVVGWGASADRVYVIYNAVEVAKVVPVAKPAGERWIVSAARLVPWKGMSALVDVMKDLPAHVKLKIIGDGPEHESLKSKVKSQKLDDRVELLGNRSHQETLSYIVAADLFILNSGYEGLSHVLLEAIGLGTSVLASRVGGNPEVIADEAALFAYNSKEELQKKIIARVGQRMAPPALRREFMLSTMIEQTKQLLTHL